MSYAIIDGENLCESCVPTGTKLDKTWDHDDHDGGHGYCDGCGESICPQRCADEEEHFRREFEAIGHAGKDYFSSFARDFPDKDEMD